MLLRRIHWSLGWLMRTHVIFFLLVSLLSRVVWSLEESSLPTTLQTQVIPYFQSSKTGAIQTPDHVQIRYRIFEPNVEPFKGNLVIISGRTGFMWRSAELLYDLRNSGYRIFIYDHRGQGESQRLLSDSHKGYVNDFNDYVKDLDQFLTEVVKSKISEKTFLLAHSMGGAVATRYVIEHPDRVTALVLTSPMYRANTDSIPPTIAYYVLNFMVFIGQGEEYTFGRSADDWQNTFENNDLTHSENRHNFSKQLMRENNALIVAGPTHRWVREALGIGFWIESHAKDIKTPLLILQSKDDTVVSPAAEAQVCVQSSVCNIVPFSGAKHDLLMEQDVYRNEAIKQALGFYQRHSDR